MMKQVKRMIENLCTQIFIEICIVFNIRNFEFMNARAKLCNRNIREWRFRNNKEQL